MSVPICSADSILSNRARSTLRILPRSGSTAWYSRLRPCLADAAGRVALDEEDLGLRRVPLLAVGELAGQVRDVDRALAAGELARLARGLARLRRLDDLAHDHPRLAAGAPRTIATGVRRPGPRRPAAPPRTPACPWSGEENFGSGHLDREHAGQPLARVVAGQIDLLLLGKPALGIGDDRAGQRAAEARRDACRRRAAGCCW